MLMSEQEIIGLTVERLVEMLGVPSETVRVENGPFDSDALIAIGLHSFVVEAKTSSTLGQVVPAVDRIKAASARLGNRLLPLLVVPYMGRSGREYCEREGVSWLDLSGNARIVAPGLFVNSVGHRNRFLRPGRVESPFSPRGSRVAMRFLLEPKRTFKQIEIAELTGLHPSHVSRVVRRLLESDFVEMDSRGVRVRDAGLLLDAWRADYRFERHRLIRGHVTALAGDTVARLVGEKLEQMKVRYALTGLAAAWLYTTHAGYRLTTIHVGQELSEDDLRAIKFREESRGANTWLVLPRDDGVFEESRKIDGLNCANPLQVYLDLKAHPERSGEAAQELRDELLRF